MALDCGLSWVRPRIEPWVEFSPPCSDQATILCVAGHGITTTGPQRDSHTTTAHFPSLKCCSVRADAHKCHFHCTITGTAQAPFQCLIRQRFCFPGRVKTFEKRKHYETKSPKRRGKAPENHSTLFPRAYSANPSPQSNRSADSRGQ